MRRKIIFGLCLAAALGLSATGFMLNQKIGAQDTPQKAEPEKKKADDLFELLKSSLPSNPDAGQPVPLPPPTLPTVSQPAKDTASPPPLTPTAPVIPPPTLPQTKNETPPVAPQPMLPPVVDTPKPSVPAPVVQPKEAEKPMPSTITFPPQQEPKAPTPTQSVQPAANDVKPPPVNIDPPTRSTTTLPSQVFPEPPTRIPGGTPATAPPTTTLPPQLTPTPQFQESGTAQSTLPRATAQPLVDQVAKMKDCPWTMHVAMIDGQTIVTATVNKKHEFKIVCQTLDLQTGNRSLNAYGKVQISGDMMTGSCEHLTISLSDDRLVLERSAEVRIQKISTNVSDTRPASFELKGQMLNLRISELESGKVTQTGLRQTGNLQPAMLPDLPAKTVSMPNSGYYVAPPNGQKWTPYGTLRRLESKTWPAGEGEWVWVLVDRAENTIAQIVARDGGTLKQYEGQRISVLGSPEQINGGTFLRVTHIALP